MTLVLLAVVVIFMGRDAKRYAKRIASRIKHSPESFEKDWKA